MEEICDIVFSSEEAKKKKDYCHIFGNEDEMFDIAFSSEKVKKKKKKNRVLSYSWGRR